MKRNPAPAASPNSAIDLTPLLDLLFLLLFVILLSYVQLSDQESAAWDQKNEELQQDLLEYQSRDYDYETIAQSYQTSILQYEELDQIVRKITLYCNYDHNNPSKRTLRVIIPGAEDETIQLDKDHTENGYAKLKRLLDDYIQTSVLVSQQESVAGNSVTDDASFIIIFLSLDQIQRGDRERIDKIATDLMERYENVYYRKFRAE